MPFYMLEDDITRVHADAIVNAANTRLMPGSGVCGAIFRAAGFMRLREACTRIGHCDSGCAVITPGFDLPARFIIHTPGPVWLDGLHDEETTLRRSYRSCMRLALKNDCHSIAFPLISAGIYGYPFDEALRIAKETIVDFLQTQNADLHVFMVLLKRPQHYAFRENKELSRYLLDLERSEQEWLLERSRSASVFCDDLVCEAPQRTRCFKTNLRPYDSVCDVDDDSVSLEDELDNVKQTFSEKLLHLIETRSEKPSDIYKKANIDRKLFHKIRQDRDYHPSKVTVLAFSAALELSVDETDDLLNAAGFAFSRSSRTDIIVHYYFERHIYDIFTINDALFYYGEPLLGNSIK